MAQYVDPPIGALIKGGQSRIETGESIKSIPHGLGSIPTWVQVSQMTEIDFGIPEILGSAGDLSYEADSTNITISITVTQIHPVYFSWSAGK